jgi:hypothetical protein
MLRWTRRFLTLLCFLLLGQSLALWVRSYMLADYIHHQRAARSAQTLTWDHRTLTNSRGLIGVSIKHSVWTLPHPQLNEQEIAHIREGFTHDRLPQAVSDTFGMKQPPRFGFGHERLNTQTPALVATGRILVFPWAIPTLLFAILPCNGVVRFLAARRRIHRLKALNWNGMQTRKLAA